GQPRMYGPWSVAAERRDPYHPLDALLAQSCDRRPGEVDVSRFDARGPRGRRHEPENRIGILKSLCIDRAVTVGAAHYLDPLPGLGCKPVWIARDDPNR